MFAERLVVPLDSRLRGNDGCWATGVTVGVRRLFR
jgi:hypothetical protein